MRRALIAAVVALALGGMFIVSVFSVGGGGGASGAACSPGGEVTGSAGTGGTGLDAASLGNAATVIAAGEARPVPLKAEIVALAVARQESDLHNLANSTVPESLDLPHEGVGSDHDSVGVFQQRASWGPVETRMDVTASAALFYQRLLALPGWEAMTVGAAAQAVQVSATPLAYGRWEALATTLVASLSGLGCGNPAGSVFVSGDARVDAQAILSLWGTRITGNLAAKGDLADTASGAGFESCGHHISLDADLLHLYLLILAQFDVIVTNYATDHGCDKFYHPPGMASDLAGVTEIATGLSTNFTPGTAGSDPAVVTRFDDFLAENGPNHLGLGQLGCGDHLDSNARYLQVAFPDKCNHRHLNVHQGDPQWGAPYIAEVWPH